MYIKVNLNKLVETEKEFLKSIKEKKALFDKFSDNEIYHLSTNIVEKIISLQEDILQDNSNLIKFYASLRYILETLIQTEILLIEPTYTFKLFYSIHFHQIDKTKKLIKRIRREIQIMSEYELEDRKNNQKFIKDIKQEKDIEIASLKRQDAIKKLDDKSDLEYKMFCGNYKWFGYGYIQSHLEEKVLPEYINRLASFEKGKIEIAKKIIKKDYISRLFNFRGQYTKVFKEFKDDRTWKDKAITVNLEKEYELIYDMSSAILHSTSYSYITSNDTSEQEIEMVLNLCFNYSKKIMLNINSFANMTFYDKFIMINNEEEDITV